MMNTYEKLADANWLYPEQQNDWAIRSTDGVSGPFSSYAAMYCSLDTDTYPEYSPLGSAWLNGTLGTETTNSIFPFDDLWEEPPANGYGYTHEESEFHHCDKS